MYMYMYNMYMYTWSTASRQTDAESLPVPYFSDAGPASLSPRDAPSRKGCGE